jgi:hypothetical protein
LDSDHSYPLRSRLPFDFSLKNRLEHYIYSQGENCECKLNELVSSFRFESIGSRPESETGQSDIMMKFWQNFIKDGWWLDVEIESHKAENMIKNTGQTCQ